MKDFIWFVEKMFQLLPQVWAVRSAKHVAITIYGEDDGRLFVSYKKKLMKLVEGQVATVAEQQK